MRIKAAEGNRQETSFKGIEMPGGKIMTSEIKNF
jgi:hypothetical protein